MLAELLSLCCVLQKCFASFETSLEACQCPMVRERQAVVEDACGYFVVSSAGAPVYKDVRVAQLVVEGGERNVRMRREILFGRATIQHVD